MLLLLTTILDCIHWVRLLILFGGHKTAIGAALAPTVIFTGGFGSKHWISWKNIQLKHMIV